MKVAIIGCGGIGQVHSAAYQQMPGVQVVAAADIRLEYAQKVADQHAAKAYPSLETLLANEKPDMADICVPTYLHASLAISCMQRGLHVLCEKPMALNLADAQAMADCAARNGVLFMVAQVIRFWPEYAYLKHVYDQGTYGPLLQASFSRTCGAPLWAWDGWYTDPQRSGLAPFDLHVHDADYINYLLGKPARVHSAAVDQPGLFISTIHTRYFFDNDALVEAEAGWYPGQVPFAATFRAVFAGAVLDYRNEALTLYEAGNVAPRKLDLAQGVAMGASINLTSTGAYTNECAYFVKCVQDKTPPTVITPQQSLISLKMVLTEIESAKTGQVLAV
jgi:predicted dehydrogenase